MAAVQTPKQRLTTVTLVDKYKTLKEIDGGQSCVATAKRYGAKNTAWQWLTEKTKIFEAVERNNVSKKRKKIKTVTYEELHSG